MEFLLLGAVRARQGAQSVPLGPRQQRLVFAVLAWEVGRPVSVDRLISLLWPDSPPRTAEHAVRVCVSKLRSILAGHAELTAQGSGYVLRADPLTIDAHRFLDLVEQARATVDDRRKVEVLDEALGQWQGPALADTASDEIRERLFGGLTEAKLVATEDRFDALLRLGRHHSVVSSLASLAETYPARERLVGQLMLALHRGGQSGHALDVARRTASTWPGSWASIQGASCRTSSWPSCVTIPHWPLRGAVARPSCPRTWPTSPAARPRWTSWTRSSPEIRPRS
ncbi:AfsR/SARP family transcriptional regulator [Kibdelosporangium aridum]|uniref:AfsR/SARP family transcriptional regulator n=1 Tax=Kibdelosporangium aridum TaxID=2030 RepID=UPI000A6EEACE